MNRQRIFTSVLTLILLLVLTQSISLAQEPDQGEDIDELNEPGAMSSIVPIQGRLTDASGNPLDGNYNVTAFLYDVSTGGDPLCDDADPVTVNNGLFNMYMNYCSAADIDGDQLYLGIEVESDGEMIPRQAIYPVPYAWTVKPGAIIKGSTTYVHTPGSAFVKNNSNDSTRWNLYGAGAQIYRGAAAGSKYIRIPITMPSVLYGQNVRITEARIEYRCQNGTNNYISRTLLYKMTSASTFDLLFDNTTDRTSNVASNYTLTTDSNFNTLSPHRRHACARYPTGFC
jgi:hypothetical protein